MKTKRQEYESEYDYDLERKRDAEAYAKDNASWYTCGGAIGVLSSGIYAGANCQNLSAQISDLGRWINELTVNHNLTYLNQEPDKLLVAVGLAVASVGLWAYGINRKKEINRLEKKLRI
jgi:hypothetical protein